MDSHGISEQSHIEHIERQDKSQCFSEQTHKYDPHSRLHKSAGTYVYTHSRLSESRCSQFQEAVLLSSLGCFFCKQPYARWNTALIGVAPECLYSSRTDRWRSSEQNSSVETTSSPSSKKKSNEVSHFFLFPLFHSVLLSRSAPLSLHEGLRGMEEKRNYSPLSESESKERDRGCHNCIGAQLPMVGANELAVNRPLHRSAPLPRASFPFPHESRFSERIEKAVDCAPARSPTPGFRNFVPPG